MVAEILGIEKDMVFYVLRIVKEIKSPTTRKVNKDRF